MSRWVLLSVILFVLSCFAVPSGWAGEPEVGLSLDGAIARSLAHDAGVLKGKKEIERTEEMLNFHGRQLGYAPVGPPGTAMVEIPWVRVLQSNLTWQMSKKQLTAAQEQVALGTCNRYWAVLRGQDNVLAAEANLIYSRNRLQNARVKYQAGIIPGTVLMGLEAGYRGAVADLATARYELEKAYESLNQAVGFPLQERPILTDRVQFDRLEVVNLDTELGRILNEAPTVWLAQARVTLQEYLKEFAFYTGEYQPYQIRRIEAEQAKLDAMSARDALELATRELYYTVRSLEEAYYGAEEALKVTEEALRIVRIRNIVGLATLEEVAQQEVALVKARQSVFELACRHAYLKLAFQKPWALPAGGMGSR